MATLEQRGIKWWKRCACCAWVANINNNDNDNKSCPNCDNPVLNVEIDKTVYNGKQYDKEVHNDKERDNEDSRLSRESLPVAALDTRDFSEQGFRYGLQPDGKTVLEKPKWAK